MNDGTKTYTCFVCLMGSSDPEICTNCGARIETIDIEKIVVTPPRWGEYSIHSDIFSPEVIAKVIDEVISNWHQNFQVLMKSPYEVIRSNERAYDKFVDTLSKSKNMPIEEVKRAIPFTPIPEK